MLVMSSICKTAEFGEDIQTRQVVDVASIHDEVSIFGVTERGKVTRQRHAGTHIPPQRAWGGGDNQEEKSNQVCLLNKQVICTRKTATDEQRRSANHQYAPS